MMRSAVLGSVLFIVLVCGTIHTALALRCGSRIVSRGDVKWHVQEVCGEPASIDEHEEVITEKKYNQQQREYTEHTTYITYEIWRYKLGMGRLAHILIFRDHTLVDVMTEKRYRNYWKNKKSY